MNTNALQFPQVDNSGETRLEYRDDEFPVDPLDKQILWVSNSSSGHSIYSSIVAFEIFHL